MTAKTLALVDALGNLVPYTLLPGHRHDTKRVKDLIADVSSKMLLADEAFDVDWLRAELDDKNIVLVIPPKADRKSAIPCDVTACE